MYMYLVIGWVEPDASICMFVCLVEGVLLEQEVGTVAMDGGGFLGQVVLLADIQSFEVSLQGSFVVLEILVVTLCLSIQLSHNLLLCIRIHECEVCAYTVLHGFIDIIITCMATHYMFRLILRKN